MLDQKGQNRNKIILNVIRPLPVSEKKRTTYATKQEYPRNIFMRVFNLRLVQLYNSVEQLMSPPATICG